jgi:cell shape-determining protein MreC
VEQAGAWTSRVVLLSDVLASRGTRVHVVPADPGRPGPRLDGRAVAFVLVGQGQGRMRVLDIAAGFVDSGQVAVGDWVTSSADDPKLCVPLVIGRITALRHNRQKPLYYDAVVCFPQDPKSLREVFVVGMTRTDS